jgi:hypothetical protein
METDVNQFYDPVLLDEEFSYKEDAWDPLEDFPEETHIKLEYTFGIFEALSEDVREISPWQPTTPRIDSKIDGMEVGDDREDISYNPRRLALELSAQEGVFRMKTSDSDTSITRTIWNFCETTGMLPAAKEQSFDYCRKTGNFENLSFIDSPPLRIVLDTRKGDRSHSNSSVGKASMLSSRVYACRTEFRDTLDISSFFQDANLASSRMPDPKYLPRIMGGCGNSAPFRNDINTYLYVHSYKGGTYERVYATATQELVDCLTLNEEGQSAEPLFCTKLRDKQEYLHGTYAEKVFVPDGRPLVSPYWEVPEPIYQAAGTSIGISSVENRLIRARRLVTKRVAREVVQQADRLLQVIKGESTINGLDLRQKITSFEKRKEYEYALQANSAFQRLLSRCANDTDVSKLLSDKFFKAVTSGRLTFTIGDAQWLGRGGKGRFLTINDLRTSEDMYILSEISLEETFKIGGIPLSIPHSTGVVRVNTKTRIGLYEISQSQEEWADNVVQNLLSSSEVIRPLNRNTVIDIFKENLDWVNDDSMIIHQSIIDNEGKPKESTFVILISTDKRLAKQIARASNQHVLCYNPSDIVERLYREVWSSESKISIQEIISIDPTIGRSNWETNPPSIYIDTGSLMAASVKYSRLQSRAGIGTLFRRELLGVTYVSHRTARYLETEIPSQGYPPIRKNIYSPQLGKPRVPEFLRTHGLTFRHENFSTTDRTLSINSRAALWKELDYPENSSA